MALPVEVAMGRHSSKQVLTILTFATSCFATYRAAQWPEGSVCHAVPCCAHLVQRLVKHGETLIWVRGSNICWLSISIWEEDSHSKQDSIRRYFRDWLQHKPWQNQGWPMNSWQVASMIPTWWSWRVLFAHKQTVRFVEQCAFTLFHARASDTIRFTGNYRYIYIYYVILYTIW